MTGKELKAWADFIHDDATIEHSSGYASGWCQLSPQHIRAIYQCPQPAEESDSTKG